MKRQFKGTVVILILVMLVCSLFSCEEDKELQVFIQDNGAVITADGVVALVGTGNGVVEDIDVNRIDYLVIQDYTQATISGFSRLCAEYDIENIYMPAYDDITEEFNEFIDLCYNEDPYLIRVEGSMSFAVGNGSVTVSAGTDQHYADKTDRSLMTRVVMGENRMLFCGSAKGERLAEYIQLEKDKYTHLNLTSAQMGVEAPIVQALLPDCIIYTGCDPYVSGYDVYDKNQGPIIYKG